MLITPEIIMFVDACKFEWLTKYWMFNLNKSLTSKIKTTFAQHINTEHFAYIYVVSWLIAMTSRQNLKLSPTQSGAVLRGGQSEPPKWNFWCAFGQMGWKSSDCMLVVCQKLHICTFNQQNCSGDRPPFGDSWPPLDPQTAGARTVPGLSLHRRG